MKEIPPRILNEAKIQAQRIATSIANRYSLGTIKSWADIKAQYGIEILPMFADKPWTYANVADIRNANSLAYYWLNGYELRLMASMSSEQEAPTISLDKNVETFGEFTLQPDQQGVLNYAKEFLVDKNHTALLDMSYPGAGKGVTASCFLAKLYKEGYFARPENNYALYQAIIICPRSVAEHWRRELVKAGLESKVDDSSILIFPFSRFAANSSDIYCSEVEDYTTGECSLKWNEMFAAPVVIIDELHNFCNKSTYRTKAILALSKTKQKKFFYCLSATPTDTINGLHLFTLLAQPTFQGVKIKSPVEFGFMARCLDARPDRPNVEALKRYRGAMESYMVSVPYVKPKHKATTIVQLCEFENQKARDTYNSAIERYKIACAKAGKNTAWGRWQRAQELRILNQTVEPLRVPWMAQHTADNYRRGDKATLMGGAYLETISEYVYTLVSKHNIPRAKISVIWGGKEGFKPKDLLTQDQLKSVLSGNLDELNKLFEKDPRMGKRIITTLNYVQDQEQHGEDAEQQARRHQMLRDLKLTGVQTLDQRQCEIDKFQSGETVVNAFTVYCGREGLSFDRSKPELLVRDCLYSMIYNGKQFKQLLGRAVRRQSLSDAIQRICMMAGTSEEWHLAPKLDVKLKCISAITNRFIDAVDLLLKDEAPEEPIVLRTLDEAADDADKDILISEAVPVKDEDEDEDLEDLDTLLA